ncbi:MAG: hypothetical protein H8E55_48420 [Pelagibacterales bacterium]|nr:hypothetical protein [Pelagibacterales bacterium]
MGQYTYGMEWMEVDTLKEHIGLFHTYPNGAAYTNANWTDRSKQLMPFVEQTKQSELLNTDGELISSKTVNNSIYFKLTGRRFNNYHAPEYYYPIPTDNEYERAKMQRYFVQKKNDISTITEISPLAFDSLNSDNDIGIDSGVYKSIKIEWSIDGPIKDVRKNNIQIIKEGEKQFPNLSKYLTDLDEFHKLRNIVPE